MGEFGVVMMLGGKIPGVTQTLSISIYDDVQAMNYAAASQAALLLLVASFLGALPHAVAHATRLATMSESLVARFERRFNGEPTIAADLTLAEDRFSITVLFGPSGCGKTTILRCLAGLDRPEAGSIHLGQRVWFDAEQRVCLSPQDRDIGFLFQEYALFPHLTVAENIGYSLGGVVAALRQQAIEEMLVRFDLQGLDQRFPRQISGGQQQRVALARALIRRPRLLLLDEPLSAPDAATREQLRSELRRLLAEFAIPVVLVTHDRLGAMAMADQVVVLDQGRVAG